MFDLLNPLDSLPGELRARAQRHQDFLQLAAKARYLEAFQQQLKAQPSLAKHVQQVLRSGALAPCACKR